MLPEISWISRQGNPCYLNQVPIKHDCVIVARLVRCVKKGLLQHKNSRVVRCQKTAKIVFFVGQMRLFYCMEEAKFCIFCGPPCRSISNIQRLTLISICQDPKLGTDVSAQDFIACQVCPGNIIVLSEVAVKTEYTQKMSNCYLK